MYYADNKQHHVPHIHAEYGNDKAVFSIEDGRLFAGKSLKIKLASFWHGSKFAVKN